MKTPNFAKLLLGTGFLALSTSVGSFQSAEAAVIRSPISATATSEFSSDFSIGKTINQSGLNLGFTSGVTDFDA